MRDTVLIEEMVWLEARDAIAAGTRRGILVPAAMEQRGPHLPTGADTDLGHAIDLRLAQRLGDALVAPVIALGYSVGHLPVPGTVSVEEPTFETVVGDACRSLAHHHIRAIVLLRSHGGTDHAPQPVLPALREELCGIRLSTAPDVDEWLEHAKAFAARGGLDMARPGVHAGQGETSLMLADRPDRDSSATPAAPPRTSARRCSSSESSVSAE